MSEIKHTPGPWAFKRAPNGDIGICADHTGIFAEAFADIRHQGEDARAEALANGRLIAAAPELLAALKHARDQIQHPDQMIDEAIAKAEGRS